MRILINEEVKAKAFNEFKSGDLIVRVGGSVIHIKTSEGALVNLLTGYFDISTSKVDLFVDVTDKYILTNIK